MTVRTFLLMSLFAAGCGDNVPGAVCGDLTKDVDGVCVAVPGPTCGSSTTLINGVCVATPGPTCGPGTVLSGAICAPDPTVPGPVTGLTATAGSGSVTVSWTAGDNATATLVARLDAGAAAAPAALTTYAVGDTLPGGATVIAVGAATSVTDAATTPGRYSYMAWPIDKAGTYGLGREAATLIPLPAETGAISLDLTGSAGSVGTQPADITLATDAPVFDTDHATVNVSITNHTAGPLYTPRLIVSSLSVGTLGSFSGLTSDKTPFLLAGTGAILPGATLTYPVLINGVAATDTIAASVAIEESGLAVVGENILASAGGGGESLALAGIRGNGDTGAHFMGGVFSPSGRYFYGVVRWASGLFRFDTATHDVVAISPIGGGLSGAGTCVVLGDDGFAYTVIQIGGHRRRTGVKNTLGIARIDLGTMTTMASETLSPDIVGRVTACALQGTRLAVSYGGGVYFFRTDAMTFEDADGTTPVIDPVAVDTTSAASARNVHALAFDHAGNLYAASKQQQGAIFKIDATNVAADFHDIVNGDARDPQTLTVDANGTLWWPTRNGLFSFNGSAEVSVPHVTGAQAIVSLDGTTAQVLGSFGKPRTSLFTVDLHTGEVTNESVLPNTNRIGHHPAVFR